jgi:hypothetical protein
MAVAKGLMLQETQAAIHFSLLETSENVVLSLLPRVETAVIIVTAISDAIRPYSIAVAPDSLQMKTFSLHIRRLSRGQFPAGRKY